MSRQNRDVYQKAVGKGKIIPQEVRVFVFVLVLVCLLSCCSIPESNECSQTSMAGGYGAFRGVTYTDALCASTKMR